MHRTCARMLTWPYASIWRFLAVVAQSGCLNDLDRGKIARVRCMLLSAVHVLCVTVGARRCSKHEHCLALA